MSKASVKALGELHGKLAEVLKDALSKEYITAEGMKVPPPAQILNVARQFLKDNSIDAVPVKGTPLGDLADLPVFDDSFDEEYVNNRGL